MSPASKQFSALFRSRCWATLLLGVLLLEPQFQPVRAVACPPSRPADKPQAATAPAPTTKGSSGPPVQIDVVLVQARGRLAGQFARYALGHSKQGNSDGGTQKNLYSGILDSARDARALRAFLKELQKMGMAKITAEPRLVSAGLSRIGIQFEEIGTRLYFTPLVRDNGKIHLEIESEVSQLNSASSTTIGERGSPGCVTQRVRTTFEIENGQMLVLGGLLQHTVNASEERVPVLGALPIVGLAFSKKTFQEVDTELMYLITPHVIKPAGERKQ